MNKMGDEDAAASSRELLEKLKTCELWSSRIAILLPTVNARLRLNRLAETDLDSHIAYLDWVRTYHEEIRKYFYPYIFQESPIEAVKWQNLPQELPGFQYFKQSARNFTSAELAALFLLTCLIYFFAGYNLRRNTELR